MTTTQADLIREARERAGLGVVALARKIDPPKSSSFISRVESGQIKVTHPGTIASLAETLGIDPDEIYVAGGLIPHDIRDAITALDPAGLFRLRLYLGIG